MYKIQYSFCPFLEYINLILVCYTDNIKESFKIFIKNQISLFKYLKSDTLEDLILKAL